MKRKNAFTLIELLVVIAIIGILVALLGGAFGGLFASGRRTQCLNNLSQIGKAVQTYASSWDDTLPTYNNAPTDHWLRRLGNYMGVKTAGADENPTRLECAQSKGFLSPMALHVAKNRNENTLEANQLSYAFNHTLNTPTSSATAPRRLSEFEYSTQTMAVVLGARDNGLQGWLTRANYTDYNSPAAPVFTQTGNADIGATMLWLDGRAKFVKQEEIPKTSAQAAQYWSDGAKEYNYGWGMFWQGLGVFNATRMPP